MGGMRANLALSMVGLGGGCEFDPANTRIVAKGGSGGVDANTIQAAIDSITTADEANPHVIFIFPGVYVEDLDFTGKPFIHMVGVATAVAPVIVQSAGGVTLTLANTGTADNMGFSCHSVRFESVYGRVVDIPAGDERLTHVFMNCWFSCDLTNDAADMISNDGHHLVFWSGKMRYDATEAAGAAEHRMIFCDGEAELYLQDNHLEMNVDCTDDNVTAIHMDAGDDTRFQVEGNEIRVRLNNAAFAGDAIAVFAGGEGANKHCRGNTIRVFASGSGDLYAYYLESTTGNAMYSQGNKIYVDGGTNNYYAHTGVAGHDTFYTHYDQAHAANWITGAGAYDGQYSPMEGYHHGTLSATIPRLNLNSYLPCVLTGNEDDYSPVGLSNANTLIFTGAGNYEVTGIERPALNDWGDREGRVLMIVYYGKTGHSVTFKNQDGASTAENRFGFGEDITLWYGDGCTLIYSTLEERWVCVGKNNRLPDYIHIEDQKANNTNGGTFNAGAWRTRDLTVEVTDEGSHATLAANQVSLVAGTYVCRASAPAYKVGQHKIKLRNVTDGSDTLIGSSEVTVNADAVATRSMLAGMFSITDTKAFELQHWGTVNVNNTGFGAPVNTGVVEVYSILEFWKVR